MQTIEKVMWVALAFVLLAFAAREIYFFRKGRGGYSEPKFNPDDEANAPK